MKEFDVPTAPAPTDTARSEERVRELDEAALEQVTGGSSSGLAMEADIVSNDLGPEA